MKLLIQRVTQATVTLTEHNKQRSIKHGIVVYVGFAHSDELHIDEYIAKATNKLLEMRLFSHEGKLSKSLLDVGGSILLISNFTLYGRPHKGTQVDRSHAASYQQAHQRYQQFLDHLRQTPVQVETGEFGAMMQIDSIVDGPVNLVVDLG